MNNTEALTTQTARRRLGNCSLSMVYKLLDQGEISGYKIGRSWRIWASSVQAYIRRQEDRAAGL